MARVGAAVVVVVVVTVVVVVVVGAAHVGSDKSVAPLTSTVPSGHVDMAWHVSESA